MNKIAMLMSAVAALGMTTAASAETWTPSSTTATLSGTLEVQKLLGPFTCGVSGSITTPAGAGSATLNSLSLVAGDAACSSITISTTGSTVVGTPGSPKTVTINNLQITAITGTCRGSITGTYLGAGQIQFNNATIPSSSGIGNCRISGIVSTSPALDFS